MSTGEPEAKRNETRPRERRRLKLIESYGAFSDDRLQEVAQKIRGITSDNDTQPTALQGDASPSSGEITESITQCSLDETEGVKEKQGFENAWLISTNPRIHTPLASPDESPLQLQLLPPSSADAGVLLTENQACRISASKRSMGG